MVEGPEPRLLVKGLGLWQFPQTRGTVLRGTLHKDFRFWGGLYYRSPSLIKLPYGHALHPQSDA